MIDLQHLSARRAERPQRRELPGALRDRDRERVRDDERADEERDPAEREQEPAQERDERVRVRRVRLHLLRGRLHLGVGGRIGRIALDELRGRDVRLGGDRDLVELSLLAEQRLGRRQVEARERRAADRRDRELNCTMPEILNCSTGPSACTPIVCRPRGASSTRSPCRSRPRRPRPGARDERQRVEARLAFAIEKPRFGAPPSDDRPSRPCRSGASSHRDASFRLRDARRAPRTFGEERLVERRRGRAVWSPTVERGLAGDDRVRALRMSVKILSNACVIESVRTNVPLIIATPRTIATRGQRRPQLAAEEPGTRTGHAQVMRRRPLPSPRGSRASRTRRARCTISPSARNSTRLAIAAARASCVTITIVCPYSSTERRRSSRISPLVAESRLPVGSSAKSTVGLRDERARDRDALLLPAGELRRAGGCSRSASPTSFTSWSNQPVVRLLARDRQRQRGCSPRASASGAG